MTPLRRWATSAALGAISVLLLAAPVSAQYQQTWHFDQARISRGAEAAGKYGQGVTVAVIDTWVYGAHPAFQGRVLAGADCVGGCRDGAAAPDGCADHGTHVSGTIASFDYGAAPKARILPLRVLNFEDGECTASSTDVTSAIRYAISHGVKVINLSLAGDTPLVGQSSDITQAVSDAADAGIVVIFAAGNSGAPASDNYGTDALIVAATAPSGQLATYSQRGVTVDIAAPGGQPNGDTCAYQTCVVAPVPGSCSGGCYGAMAGTSMAAPHVSGVAALLFAQSPGRSRTDVINRMLDTARPLASGGAGIIDATAALGATSAPPPPTKSPAPKPSLTPVKKPATVKPSPSASPSASPSPTVASIAPSPTPSLSPSEPAPSSSPDVVELPPLAIDDIDRTRPMAVGLAGATAALVLLGHLVVRRRTVF